MTKLYQKFLEGLDKKSKKFHLFRGSEHHQELDLETVRNIIVNKISKILAQKMNRPVEEVEDNIRLREIQQGGATGNYFAFKYSVYNRPLMPWYTTLEPNDLFDYMKPGFDVTKHDGEESDEEDIQSDEEEDVDTIDTDEEDNDEEDLDGDEENDEEDDEDLENTEPDDSLYDGQISESLMMKSFNKFRKSNIINLNEYEQMNEGLWSDVAGNIGDIGRGIGRGARSVYRGIRSVDDHILKGMEFNKREKEIYDDITKLENLKKTLTSKKFNLYDIRKIYKNYLIKMGAEKIDIDGVSEYSLQQIMELIQLQIDEKNEELNQLWTEKSKYDDTIRGTAIGTMDNIGSGIKGAFRRYKDWRDENIKARKNKPTTKKTKVKESPKGGGAYIPSHPTYNPYYDKDKNTYDNRYMPSLGGMGDKLKTAFTNMIGFGGDIRASSGPIKHTIVGDVAKNLTYNIPRRIVTGKKPGQP